MTGMDGPLRSRLLDALLIGALAGILLTLSEPTRRWASGLMVVLVALIAIGWVLWRIRPRGRRLPIGLRRGAVVVTALASVPTTVLGDSPLAFGVVWAAALMLVLELGTWAGIGYGAVLAGIALAVHLMVGRDLLTAALEAVAVGLLSGFGIILAQALRAADELNSARLQALSALRHQYASDTDLVLAEERARTGRALHDGLGHRLTAVGMSLEFAERMRPNDPDRAWQEVDRARTEAATALTDMRRLVRAMHPVDLATAGTDDSFTAIADGFRRTGLDVAVEVHGVDRLEREQVLLLVRFVQEGLTNVVRHSRATAASLQITVTDEVVATISDDGSTTGDEAVPTEGFGLRSLRERAERLGGGLTAGPAEAGFTVRLRLPATSVAVTA